MQLAALLVWLAAFAVLGITALNPGGRMAIASLVADVAGWVFWFTAKIAPTIAVQLAKGLVRSFEQDRQTWEEVVQVFTNEMAAIIGAGGAAVPPGSLPVGPSAANIAQPLTQAIRFAITPTGELTAESGAAHLETLLGLMFALGLQGWWVEVVGDLVSLGKFGAAADLPDAIERSMGLSRLGRLAWRTPIKKGIQEPLEELYNRQYRFKKLTVGEATQLWHKGQIDDATFLDAAAAAGYSPERAAQLLSLGQKFYDVQQIRDLQRLFDLDDASAVQLLREQGYTSGRDATLLQILKARELEVVLKELAVEARKLYRTGRLTQGQLEAILSEAKYPQREIGVILATEDLIRAESKQLTVGEIQAALRDGALDPGPARQRLRVQGYRDEDIDILLTVRGRVPSSGQIIDAVSRGRITPEQGIVRLEREGYSPADAELLVSLRGRRLSEGQIVDALREGIINAQTARADLQALGFPPDAVDVLLAFIRRVLSPADVQTALLRGIITEQEARLRLLDAGYAAADVDVLITLRRRLLRIGDILSAYADGFITRTEALGDLQARGLNAEDALTVVRVLEKHLTEEQARRVQQAPPRPTQPPRPRPPSGGRRGTGPPSA